MKNKIKRHRYIAEYEINASVKMLFPYLSTAQGLAEWFAESVNIIPKGAEKLYDIIWDGESHLSKITAMRTNAHVKYVFVDEEETDEHNLAFIEFKLTHSDMTDTSFLKIIDFSDMDSDADLKELWDNLIVHLRTNVGA
jgi:uncharacterized protein YndB with AHSA1/START domain